jgi:hypothetical protein
MMSNLLHPLHALASRAQTAAANVCALARRPRQRDGTVGRARFRVSGSGSVTAEPEAMTGATSVRHWPRPAARSVTVAECVGNRVGWRPRNPKSSRSYTIVRAGRGWPEPTQTVPETDSAAAGNTDLRVLPTRGAGGGLAPPSA